MTQEVQSYLRSLVEN